MNEPFVELEHRGDGVALLRLNRPPLNPLSKAMLRALQDHAEALAVHDHTKAVVLTGSDRAFAAGADIDEFGGPDAAREIADAFHHALRALGTIPRPVIAAVSGFALGGGLEVALGCDLRVAGDSARLGQPEILLGIIPGGGGTQRLPRLIGSARAKELIWSGRQVKAAEALAIGLVDRVVPVEEVVDHAVSWAAELGRGAVAGMGLAKRAIDEGLDRALAEGLQIEVDAFVEVFSTQDASTGIASFKEHGPGKATFAGR